MTTEEQCTRVLEVLSPMDMLYYMGADEPSRMERARNFAAHFKEVMLPAFQEERFPGIAAEALEGAMLRQIEEKSDDQDSDNEDGESESSTEGHDAEDGYESDNTASVSAMQIPATSDRSQMTHDESMISWCDITQSHLQQHELQHNVQLDSYATMRPAGQMPLLAPASVQVLAPATGSNHSVHLELQNKGIVTSQQFSGERSTGEWLLLWCDEGAFKESAVADKTALEMLGANVKRYKQVDTCMRWLHGQVGSGGASVAHALLLCSWRNRQCLELVASLCSERRAAGDPPLGPIAAVVLLCQSGKQLSQAQAYCMRWKQGYNQAVDFRTVLVPSQGEAKELLQLCAAVGPGLAEAHKAWLREKVLSAEKKMAQNEEKQRKQNEELRRQAYGTVQANPRRRRHRKGKSGPGGGLTSEVLVGIL
eukprot:gnl/MRDRNA2_/MRDRNA2_34772_c0_seq1.p1 gnl/MRDRNA2_/MRDRNA2_34772_c0~~gnl/MRDRNA2_/MRDRNA2_34772_c0_seq1.p1  ORF type:complete len:483 (+),score=99.63 gnl/MRDRNA2_/MRDRNA2_34772_c0_seq1:183-1451(+)